MNKYTKINENGDEMVATTQQWLNDTYGNDPRYNIIKVDGKTGWNTIYALRRALQIELGIQSTSNSFGPTTYHLCPNINQGEEGNLVYIVQGGLWCKGYSPGGFTGYYGNGTYAAVKKLKADMGFPTASGNMNRDIMRGLLDMSAFVLLPGGSAEIRKIQQELNYNYYTYYQIAPCDGLYNRGMNKMLIYALQKEEGIPADNATGTWGPTTIQKCPTIHLGDKNAVVKLVKYSMVCNGFMIETDSNEYTAKLDQVAQSFATTLKLSKLSNAINYTIIKSLLSSNGDTDRKAEGCDTAMKLTQEKIQTLKDNGYKIIGRYLTKVEGGLDKNITVEEAKLIFNNGLSIFLIFQEYGGGNSAFSKEKGILNATSAYEAARNLDIPYGTTIFFAVDYDPQTSDIQKYIVPYFRGIAEVLCSKYRWTYRIGVYGTRNVCKILKETNIEIDSLFVSDSSYGFSGNLGFPMPGDWAFDQFKTDLTLGSGESKVSIDKVAVADFSKGFSTLGNTYTQMDILLNSLDTLYSAAMKYTNNDRIESNTLVIRYLREQNSAYTGKLWEITGGKSNPEFKKIADKIDTSHNFLFTDPATKLTYDFYHFIATLSATTCISKIDEIEGVINWEVIDPLVDIFAGWGGDLTTFAENIQVYADKNPGKDYPKYANEIICGTIGTSSFSMVDYIADIDAVNFVRYLQNRSIPEAFYKYFVEYNSEVAKKRTNYFVSEMYGSIEKLNQAIDTFSVGNVVLDYLKAKITVSGKVPDERYRVISANAFKSFILKEMLKNN